jgi:hypothetical protein
MLGDEGIWRVISFSAYFSSLPGSRLKNERVARCPNLRTRFADDANPPALLLSNLFQLSKQGKQNLRSDVGQPSTWKV